MISRKADLQVLTCIFMTMVVGITIQSWPEDVKKIIDNFHVLFNWMDEYDSSNGVITKSIDLIKFMHTNNMKGAIATGVFIFMHFHLSLWLRLYNSFLKTLERHADYLERDNEAATPPHED